MPCIENVLAALEWLPALTAEDRTRVAPNLRSLRLQEDDRTIQAFIAAEDCRSTRPTRHDVLCVLQMINNMKVDFNPRMLYIVNKSVLSPHLRKKCLFDSEWTVPVETTALFQAGLDNDPEGGPGKHVFFAVSEQKGTRCAYVPEGGQGLGWTP